MSNPGTAVNSWVASSKSTHMTAANPVLTGENHKFVSLQRIGPFRQILLVGLLLGVAILGLLQVLQTSQVASAGFELRTLQAERGQLESEIRLLEAGIAEKARLTALHHEAITRLGMVQPQKVLQLSVQEAAPHGVPLPRRYINTPPLIAQEQIAWWEPLLERIPGFD